MYGNDNGNAMCKNCTLYLGFPLDGIEPAKNDPKSMVTLNIAFRVRMYNYFTFSELNADYDCLKYRRHLLWNETAKTS